MKCPKCNSENPADTKFCGECAAPLYPSEEISVTETLETPTEELTRGATFAGRYEIIEELGKGGMGKVYRVEDKKIKEEVALKLIKPEIASDKKTIERFSNELRMARKISQRNVCRMYDLGEEKGTHYITMEYVPGEDLKSFIRRAGPLNTGKTLFIAKQVCDGLAEAHRLGVIHRDLKPQNIMIDKEGNARIMDFGIARTTKGKGITRAGIMVGTPEYMSPEQAEVKDVDQRSDIYSLGVILYEMVTGRVPFEGETPLGIAMKHKSEMPQDPRELNTQIPEDLSKVILKCMEKDKEQRYQSAGEVRSELINIEKGIPTTEREVSKKEPKTVKIGEIKWRNLILYGGGTILLIALILFGTILLTGRQEKIDSIAVLPLENLSGDPQQEYFVDGMTEALISKLTQIGALRVRSRTSVMKYKDTLKSVPELAEELNVDAVIDGSVMRSGQKVQVRVQLIEARADRNIWSNSFERDMSDVLVMQGNIAQEIATQIKIKLTPQEQKSLEAPHAVNPSAYEAYLNGKSLFYTYDKSNNEQAIVLFKKALDLDPSFSFAYSGLSKCYAQYTNREWDLDEKWLMLGEEAAKKAIELDNQSAEAYFALGFIHEQRNEYEEMEREMRNVLKLNPNHAHAHDSLGDVMHRWHGNLEEALQEYNKALTLDPFLLPSYTNTSDVYVKQGKYGDAEQILLRSLEKQKNYDSSLRFLGRLYRFMGKYESSVEMLKKALTINPQIVTYHVDLGLTYLLQNNIDGAQAEAKFMVETLDDTPKRNFFYHYLLGRILLEQGDFQSALQNFEQALQIYNSVDQSNQVVNRGEPPVDIFKAIAETYFRQGKFKEAIIELSRMNDSPVGTFQFENYMWALKHYKLGKIHEKMNNIEIAKKEYAKFLDLWKDADPGIAEVDDAKKRLAGLKGH